MQHKPARSFLRKLWAWGCSLKLAITIASIATLLIMGGSLIMHKYPQTFGSMDQMLMSEWFSGVWHRTPGLVWWLPVSGACLALFAVNTLCCVVDWLLNFGKRWRKSGEYLIHTGFILLTIAYAWNCIDGFRNGPHPVFPGEQIVLEELPGYRLQLERFTPLLSSTGRPLDMINMISLWQGERLVKRKEVKINHPLTHSGLVVLPTSFGQSLKGFRFHLAGQGLVDLVAGSSLTLPSNRSIKVLNLLPNAYRSNSGQVIPHGDQLGQPAMQLELSSDGQQVWRVWYFLGQSLPGELITEGLLLRPLEPLYSTYSLLTINYDPGSRLALFGGVCMGIGVCLAFISFYFKRARGDRPEF